MIFLFTGISSLRPQHQSRARVRRGTLHTLLCKNDQCYHVMSYLLFFFVTRIWEIIMDQTSIKQLQLALYIGRQTIWCSACSSAVRSRFWTYCQSTFLPSRIIEISFEPIIFFNKGCERLRTPQAASTWTELVSSDGISKWKWINVYENKEFIFPEEYIEYVHDFNCFFTTSLLLSQ